MLDLVLAEKLFGDTGVMDLGIVHHKADLSVPDFREIICQRIEEVEEVVCFEGPDLDLEEDDSSRGDINEERDVDSSVCLDRNNWRFSNGGPAPESCDMKVKSTLVEEPHAVVGKLVDLLSVVKAPLNDLLAKDDAGFQRDLLDRGTKLFLAIRQIVVLPM